MTAGLLNLADLADLADRAGVPAERLRHYAEAGLLPPARRDGDRLGYPPAMAHTVRLLAGAETLGIGGGDLAGLAEAWQAGDCAAARHRLSAAVDARLDTVQGELTGRLERAASHGPGSAGWAEQTRASVTLSEDAARLQAAATLTDAPHTGACDEDCPCTTAVTVAGNVYRFPTGPDTDAVALACDLAADGGEAHDRVGVWQQTLARVLGRDPLPGTATGVALRFPLDADLAATLARLATAEYRCCSFGSYTIVIDHTGLPLEVRMPADAAGMLAAVVGLPDPPAPATKETRGGPDQP
ncbi:MerR family DNA-binding transcriptional regulator [Micromonospora sp. NPDC049374]|uniref:MerR family DNA-binding transcriptional regulator n=1 Tax=Micromonospora sp. NPDC049374 TaxID=3154352 RepID=UPI00341CB7FE